MTKENAGDHLLSAQAAPVGAQPPPERRATDGAAEPSTRSPASLAGEEVDISERVTVPNMNKA